MTDHQTYDEQLPWLQPVVDEDQPRGLSARKMLTALIIVLAFAALVTATFFWIGQRNSQAIGPPELIRAPTGAYKVRPPDRGGLDVSGESQTAFETSAGQDPDARLDLSAVPEAPIAKPRRKEPKRISPNDAKEAVAAGESAVQPAVLPAGGAGSTIQLGAFQNPAQAERAWTALSARFPAVAAMTKLVVPFSGGTRLRASASSPADARSVCQMLKAAGENCFVAQ